MNQIDGYTLNADIAIAFDFAEEHLKLHPKSFDIVPALRDVLGVEARSYGGGAGLLMFFREIFARHTKGGIS